MLSFTSLNLRPYRPTVIVVRVWRGLELNLVVVAVAAHRTQKEGGANKQNREGEALLFERDVSALVSVDIFQPNFDDDEDDGCQDDRGVPRPVSEGTRAFVGPSQSRAHRYTARARSSWQV